MKDKHYYKDGTTSESCIDSRKRHRIDGPAIEYANGDKYYYIDGKQHSEQEHRQIVEEVRALSKALRLIDPRAWVRDL